MAWTYYITDRKSCPIPLLENIRAAISASVDFIQIREKDLATLDLLSLCAEARKIAHGSRTRILLNDRFDIALAAGIDGIHLGQNSIPASQIRRAAPEGFLVGVSTHSHAEAKEALEGGADYLTLGPVFFTPSKAAYGPPLGLDIFEEVSAVSTKPVFALGGINQTNYLDCLKRRASGIAAIRLFQESPYQLREIVQRIQACSLR